MVTLNGSNHYIRSHIMTFTQTTIAMNAKLHNYELRVELKGNEQKKNVFLHLIETMLIEKKVP